LAKPNGADLSITAAPARNGPAGIEPLPGDLIGLVLEAAIAILPVSPRRLPPLRWRVRSRI
jgi:hypothetical protein